MLILIFSHYLSLSLFALHFWFPLLIYIRGLVSRFFVLRFTPPSFINRAWLVLYSPGLVLWCPSWSRKGGGV